MPRKAFTLVELAMTIFLAALLGSMGYFYLNTSTIKRSQYKTTVQSQINLIESMVFQCKGLSEQFPKELNTSTDASNTLLTELECNTSTPYAFDGGKNGFVPLPPTGFSSYRATESGTIFYISVTADNNTTQDEALQKLILNYTATQAVLEHNSTTATFKFYLSR
jgi:Tfp pilus assembly protein PilE